MKSLLTIVLFVCASSLMLAQPGEMKRREMPPDERPGPRMTERLNLTDDQQAQFDKLSSSLMRKQIAVRSKIKTAQVDLRDLMREDTPDEQKIIAKQKEINTLQGDVKSNHIGFWFDVNKILTADQRKEWKRSGLMSMHGDRRPQHRMMHGNMRPHRRMMMEEMHEE